MKKVSQFMVPLSEYATVSEDATLYEAVLALEKAQEEFDQTRDRHRAILVYDKQKKIVGKVSQLDVLRSLEPQYKEMGVSSGYSRFGLSAAFVKSMMEHWRLWAKPLDDICQKAGVIRVKEIMYAPTEGEYVKDEATLNEAIHQLIMGHHQSLLVTRGEEIVGILRLTDVFREVCDAIKTCEMQSDRT